MESTCVNECYVGTKEHNETHQQKDRVMNVTKTMPKRLECRALRMECHLTNRDACAEKQHRKVMFSNPYRWLLYFS